MRDIQTVIFLQARMSSQRLPGKVLTPIQDEPLMGYVIQRLRQAVLASKIVVLTSEEISDNPIVDYCQKLDIACYRGSLPNVAARFAGAMQEYQSDYFVRVCGDSPWVDPKLIDALIEECQQNEVDIATNACPRTFPIGITTEVVNCQTFLKNLSQFNEYQNENILTYFYEQPNDFRIHNHANPEGDWSKAHLSIDTPADLDSFKEIMQNSSIDKHTQSDWRQYLRSTHSFKEMYA
jgi:spore coat polysaccharide biosynthesis protein SpsF